MSTRDPDNPSLALCGICRFSGDYKTLDISVGGGFDLFPTCEHYALDKTCPGFAPGNLKRDDLTGLGEDDEDGPIWEVLR